MYIYIHTLFTVKEPLIFFISYYLVHCNLYLFLNEVASNAFKGALF